MLMLRGALTHPHAGRGFTLIEASISIVIMGMMLTAGLRAIAMAARDRGAVAEMRDGQLYASALMNEILAQRYTAPANREPLTTGTRRDFTTIDEFDGLSESPLRARDGTVIDGTTGWRRSAVVVLAQASTGSVGPNVTGIDAGLKLIVVTATSPRGKPTTIAAVRSAWGLPDSITQASGETSSLSMSVTVGNERQVLTTDVELLNRPGP
jgi:prepilin-type N-terminal cleavage/methylation domain-containing protein